ncbi:hypothetical protein AHAS_Ahas04G0042200 [Arachis hypogaea]
MKTQTMPTFIMVLLMVALSFASEARPDVHYCEARESVQHCNSPDCYNLCHHNYNPDCHAIMP